MKIRILSIMFVIVAFPLLLTGCIYNNTTVNISSDGSGRVVSETGALKEIFDKLGKTPSDFTSKKNKHHLLKYGGREYLAETWEDAYVNPEEINQSGAVASISREMGPVNLTPIHNGLKLNLKLWEHYSTDMKPNHSFPEFKDITDQSMQGITLYDLIAQDIEGLVLKATFNMPYDVKQVKGGTDGVTVKGKTISLDYMKMVKSGVYEWEFDSVKNVKKSTFPDVSKDSPYYDAINAVVDGGLINVYADGTFKPDKPIALDELTKILANGLGQKIAGDPTYWAKNYVMFAQKYGFVISKATPTSKNWSIPATREQVIYALTFGDNTQMAYDKVESSHIKDWDKIDPKMRDMILWGYNTGVVDIEKNEYLNPKGKITRAEVAQILYDMYWTVPKSAIVESFLNDVIANA